MCRTAISVGKPGFVLSNYPKEAQLRIYLLRESYEIDVNKKNTKEILCGRQKCKNILLYEIWL